MTEAVHAQQIMLAAIAGALVVLLGALHAMLLAFARIRKSSILMKLAIAAYAGFFVAVITLARTLHLGGIWISLVVVMLLGYLLAPHGIWHLSVGTHGHAEREPTGILNPGNEGGQDDE